ncbi:ABC transporter ATP-binding protein [Rhodococcus daqingensis]|uniref:ABC transporter ATP-binding protein n=1 Tax=Rhodococcus daqingensis TaxID=2479363 RepID=A0ABW2S275_9NOCA
MRSHSQDHPTEPGPQDPVASAPALRIREIFPRFWPYASGYRGWFGVLIALLILGPLLSAAAIWCWKLLVDDVLVPRDLDSLGPIVAGFAVLTLASALIQFAQDYLSTWLGENFLFNLRSSVFRHLQRMSSDFYTRRGQGDVQLRLSGDVAAIQTFVLAGPTQGIAAMIRIVFFSGTLFVVQWQLALITLVTAPVMLILTRHFARLRQEAAREQRRRSGAVAALAEDAMYNMTLVQCCGREEYEAKRVDSHGQGALEAQLASAKYSGIYRLLVQVVELFGGVLVFGVGVWMLINGTVTLGSLIVFLAFLRELFAPLSGLGKLTTTLFTAGAAAERVLELLDQEPSIVEKPDARSLQRANGQIRLERVTFRYPDSDRPALDDVSFTAEPGEIVALVGPSGAGKSTLARLLGRFCDPESGAVRLDGHDLRDLKLVDIRRNVALLLQDAYLLDISVGENIGYAMADAEHGDVVGAADAADADDFIRCMPNGYDSRVGHSGRMLSGGQRQRVTIARTILQDSPVIVLDEPGTALDAASLHRVMGPLRRLATGRTTIVISHNLMLARAADRILVLDEGRIVDSGSHDSLLESSGLYAQLWELQQHETAEADLVRTAR